MSKKHSTVPRGCKKKEVCPKCGRLYWNFCDKGKTNTRNICTICKPATGEK